ncbi:MAG TPA: MAB_1171c family putative transporter, partial [Micromonospora sp.]
MDSRTLAFSACAAVAWIAVAGKVAALRRDPGDPARWALTVAIALPAAGFSMAVPAGYRAVSDFFGVPNLATLLIYACIVGYSVTALVMLMFWHLPPAEARRRARRLAVGYAVVLVVLVVLFQHIDAPVNRSVDFDETHGAQPAGGAFLLVYVGAFAVGLATAARRGLQFADRAARVAPDRPWLRRGLRLVAVGSLVALGYCLGKAAFVFGSWAGLHLAVFNTVATVCACLGALVITTGFTIPSWGPRFSAARHRLTSARAYLDLYPLWHTLYQAFPAVALDPPPSRRADLLLLRDLDYRLYRRLIEIHDARLALAPYLAPVGADADTTAELRGLPADAVREAVRIRAAVARLGSGEPAPGDHDGLQSAPPPA